MAVYTDVADDELRAFIALYDIGEVLSCKGIAEGVENSNFLVTTERGNFILTLYEKRVEPRDLPFFIALMEHLARHGVACPTPVKGRDGIALRELCSRPAAGPISSASRLSTFMWMSSSARLNVNFPLSISDRIVSRP